MVPLLYKERSGEVQETMTTVEQTKNPIISVEKLDKYFGVGGTRVNALSAINFSVNPGEIVFLFGPSGSGKSTLLNILAGLEVPDKGKVIISDKDISTMSKDEKALFHREKIGMVFQSYNLIPSLTVADNISLPLVFSKILPAERNKRVVELLKEFDLSELGHRLPPEISGGQQQRIGIMRALAHRPPILIADEPTGNLDSGSATDVMNLFTRLNRNFGTTMIIVTHNPEHLHYADRVIHVLDGKVLKETVHRRSDEKDRPKASVWDCFIKENHRASDKKIIKLLEILLSSTQLDLLEQAEIDKTVELIGFRLEGKIDTKVLNKKLDLPVADGGAGLYSSTARHIAANIEAIMEII